MPFQGRFGWRTYTKMIKPRTRAASSQLSRLPTTLSAARAGGTTTPMKALLTIRLNWILRTMLPTWTGALSGGCQPRCNRTNWLRSVLGFGQLRTAWKDIWSLLPMEIPSSCLLRVISWLNGPKKIRAAISRMASIGQARYTRGSPLILSSLFSVKREWDRNMTTAMKGRPSVLFEPRRINAAIPQRGMLPSSFTRFVEKLLQTSRIMTKFAYK